MSVGLYTDVHVPAAITRSLLLRDVAIRRVAQRVAEGGHRVPISDIERRFQRGLDLLKKRYQPIVDRWTIYDASTSPPKVIEESTNHE